MPRSRPLSTLLLLATALPAVAQVDHAREYRACLVLVHRDAIRTSEAATAWAKRGGGAAADHCAALALVERGRYDVAAERLERVAGALPRDSRISPAELLAQAANVWLLAGKLEQAAKAIDIAAGLAPEDAPILIDQARIRAEGGDYRGALSALDRALALAPIDGDAHAFRAGALRRLDRAGDALEAAGQAVALDPAKPSARLERGLARLALGDVEGARLDLAETVRGFDGTPAAEAARAALAEIDKRPPAPKPPRTASGRPLPPIPGIKPSPPSR